MHMDALLLLAVSWPLPETVPTEGFLERSSKVQRRKDWEKCGYSVVAFKFVTKYFQSIFEQLYQIFRQSSPGKAHCSVLDRETLSQTYI